MPLNLPECDVLVYLSWTWRLGGGTQAGCRVQGAGWAAQNEPGLREKEDISLELVTVGRGWATFQLAWRLYQGMCVTGGLGGAVHGAAPSASGAQRQSDVIHLVDCGVVFLLFGAACFYLWPHFTSPCMPPCVYVCGFAKVWEQKAGRHISYLLSHVCGYHKSHSSTNLTKINPTHFFHSQSSHIPCEQWSRLILSHITFTLTKIHLCHSVSPLPDMAAWLIRLCNKTMG